MVYEVAKEKFALKEFSREYGWDSHTYSKKVADDYKICPYDVM